MRQMMIYDFMETLRVTNQWLGASAHALGSYPATGLVANPMFQMIQAWGDVTERSFGRMITKPDWGIDTIVGEDGRDHVVSVTTEIERPFGDLVHFSVSGRKPQARRILLIAPMSGHYATLLRSTVVSLLPDADVWITDWHNARDIPVSAGKFDVDDYTLYVADFMRHLGSDINVIAVCQPAPLALAATAYLAETDPAAQPATLTLIGGPIDPDAAATDVTDFGRRVTMGQLEDMMIQRVGFKHAGVGRKVYPGLLQLTSFMSMNAETHARAFSEQILRTAKGQASDHDKHNKFYDEYLAVMDMPAEFYLSTVDRVFKSRDVARNVFTINGTPVDIGKVSDVAVKIVEGENDDISAPGQCLAALDLLTGLPDAKKAAHLEPGAGHYGIFAGRSWRNNIRPLVLDFIDANRRDAADMSDGAAQETSATQDTGASDTGMSDAGATDTNASDAATADTGSQKAASAQAASPAVSDGKTSAARKDSRKGARRSARGKGPTPV
ncbi:Intracellular PHB depolymerase [Profundibacterium mesophilum KAUST100406-0324]|uniref:Intracellular PHB depolymerase n=1 Tax=Profundibacterium mesophilum KAUST100406-0324 TaxID=1037889 RepID=A0A921TCE2_9RHOB|nr:polyhydroxyalkanoate depolymerase [Profundibacterium mesophilum]KAF0676995.1 Intracellular PHB depolymerase [Profundibacterium mesophilum KAUST100406-0324]